MMRIAIIIKHRLKIEPLFEDVQTISESLLPLDKYLP